MVACTASAVTAESVSPAVTETYISTSGFAYNPAIYGDKIVWQDNRNEKTDIYMYDLSTKTETQITNTEQTDGNPAIYGDRIVYSSYGDPEICICSISTKKETQINISGYAENPVIYGNRIVYSSDRNGNIDVYMYDLLTKKETQITSSPDAQTYPAIYGNRVVWQDDGGEDDGWVNHGIFMYDISTNKKMRISPTELAYYPAIYSNRIVYASTRNGNTDIYIYDLSTKKETQITSSPDTQTHPAIYGNRIVWVDTGGEDDGWENHGIFMHDISTNKKMRISSSGHTSNPVIYGNKIVWGYSVDWGADDVYMGTI
ncbi:hypothetical protein [Methanosarcina sp. MSH10X1]|uniref:TolB family protein n=1 Tax=Methanosarcina sp. MSH10X1 TaxID=2507075 RepID=UPI001F0CD0C5|nr:hypothetical protein [Methanosarcina sp. MSH10X1]